MFLIALLILVAIAAEIIHRLNPFKKPEPTYEELVQQIKESPWYQELAQHREYLDILENDPGVVAFYSGKYEAQRLLAHTGYQLGFIDYVKSVAEKSSEISR